MDEQEISVPTQVIVDIEKVRQSGKYNMFESQNVFCELYHLGCYETVTWLMDENWKENSFRSQVNYKKYAAALKALSDSKVLMTVLSEV